MNGAIETNEAQLIGNLCTSMVRGKSIVYKWDGTKLGIKTEDEQEFQFVDLKADNVEDTLTVLTNEDILDIFDLGGELL